MKTQKILAAYYICDTPPAEDTPPSFPVGSYVYNLPAVTDRQAKCCATKMASWEYRQNKFVHEDWGVLVEVREYAYDDIHERHPGEYVYILERIGDCWLHLPRKTMRDKYFDKTWKCAESEIPGKLAAMAAATGDVRELLKK